MFQMRCDTIEVICPEHSREAVRPAERAVLAALVPVHSVHEMIYQQLAAALEQLRKKSHGHSGRRIRTVGRGHKTAAPDGRPGLVIVSSSGDISSMGPVTGRGEPSAWRDLVRTCSARFSHFDLFRSLLLRWTLKPGNAVYPDLSWALSIGSFRTRLPVAAKIALATAGITADVPGSPTPPGASELLTRWTSIKGASLMRSIR